MTTPVYEPGPPRDALIVQVNGDVEQALRRLKKQCALTGLFFKELKRRAYYLKPSQSIKLKMKMAQKRRAKQQRAFEERDREAPGTKRPANHFNRRPTNNIAPTTQGESR